MTYAEFINQYKPRFSCDESVANFELIELFCKVTGRSRTEVLLSIGDVIAPEHLAYLYPLVERLIQGEPLGYVLGDVYFRGERYYVEPGVLVPRPETEELVGLVLDYVSDRKSLSGTLVECGAGSGVIGLSLAKSLPSFEIFSWDISEESQRVVQKNKSAFNIENYTFKLGDFLALSKDDFSGLNSPKVLVSNPPYITNDEMLRLDPSVLNYEPIEALTDGGDGLGFYRFFSTLTQCFDAMFFECGEHQARSIVDLFGADVSCSIVTDMFGKSRFVVIEKN